jgi:peptidoglycan/LPS O-acetylase OafA/YrhL|tara:strand:- start:62 stop:1987 length:1926 start_codon:yes stop_codon:yes gene_type:complete
MLNYRPDIDGLRAVAILSVVINHANLGLLNGGFVGVDIFFVISGFLITTIILNDMRNNDFSFVAFYERRARRIFPALFFILLSSAIVAYFLLLPTEFTAFGKSLVATPLFVSNHLFLSEASYFDMSGRVKPLLHTWSLAVEEQFYVLFPIYLLLLWRFAKKWIMPLTLFALLLSLGVSEWGVTTNREETAFYVLPTRAWELAIGSMLAFNCLPQIKNKTLSLFFGISGGGLILWAILRDVGAAAFPGLNALPPTLGCALVIYSASYQKNLISEMLSFSPMVLIGKVSYSFYLWHWPVLIFLGYYLNREVEQSEAILALLFSFFLAILTWRYIERPFRGKSALLTRKSVFIISIAISLFLILCGIVIVKNQGFQSRFGGDVLSYSQTSKGRDYKIADLPNIPGESFYLGTAEHLEDISFAIWGDSHATSFSPALDEISIKNDMGGVLLKEAGCLPGFALNSPEMPFCSEYNRAVEAFLKGSQHISTIYLIARWSAYPRWWSKWPGGALETNAEAIFVENMERSVAALIKANKRVVIVHEAPHILGWSVPSVLARKTLFGQDDLDIRITIDQHKQQQQFILSVFKKIKAQFSTVAFIDPADIFCGKMFCDVERAGRSLYYDDDHLSTYGALGLLSLIRTEGAR